MVSAGIQRALWKIIIITEKKMYRTHTCTHLLSAHVYRVRENTPGLHRKVKEKVCIIEAAKPKE